MGQVVPFPSFARRDMIDDVALACSEVALHRVDRVLERRCKAYAVDLWKQGFAMPVVKAETAAFETAIRRTLASVYELQAAHIAGACK
jgi:hypothetical protein